MADGGEQQVVLQGDTGTRGHGDTVQFTLINLHRITSNLSSVGPYPSEGDDVERVLSAVDGVQEVVVGELGTRKNLQLTEGGGGGHT